MYRSVAITPNFSPYLFVYGTLMSGESRYPLLEPGGIKSIVPASVPGLLFDLGDYPGMIPAQDSVVHGELILFGQLERILDRLDEEEGSEYHRQLIRVTSREGHRMLAWTYLLASAPSLAPIIPTGDWRVRRR